MKTSVSRFICYTDKKKWRAFSALHQLPAQRTDVVVIGKRGGKEFIGFYPASFLSVPLAGAHLTINPVDIGAGSVNGRGRVIDDKQPIFEAVNDRVIAGLSDDSQLEGIDAADVGWSWGSQV